MKILKIIGIVLVSLIALFFIVTALLPDDYNVKRSIVINAPVSTVYNEVRYFKNFNNWSPWTKYDSAMVTEVTGTDGEVGAKYSWESKNQNVGSGSLTRIKQEENKLLLSELMIVGFENSSDAGFAFEEVEGGTKVTWFNSGDFPFKYRIFGLMMDKMMGKTFDEGLQKMKTHIESMPAEPAAAVATEVKTE